jgi:prepilin-type N-terminal cleavage/methylation domain-containing protein
MIMRAMRNQRPGFTLVELLVAMALTMFIMVILSQAFVTGLETFRQLKAIGDIQSSLRVAATSLRSDLGQAHFEGGRRPSDLNIASTRPNQGYLFIRQPTAPDPGPANNQPYQFEGSDADGLPSFRAVNHVMGLTVRLRGNQREDVMMSRDIPSFPPSPPAPLPQKWSPLSKLKAYYFSQPRDALFNPGGPPVWPDSTPLVDNSSGVPQMLPDTFASQWAEVYYFLWQTGVAHTEDINLNGILDAGEDTNGNNQLDETRLYGLYRAQYLLVPNTEEADNPTDPDVSGTTATTFLTDPPYRYAGISCRPGMGVNGGPTGKLDFNSAEDVADTGPPTPPAAAAGFTNRAQEMRVMGYLAALPAQQIPLTNTNPPPVPAGTQAGRPPRNSTLVVPNVISFVIQGRLRGQTDFLVNFNVPPTGVSPPGVYDTTTATFVVESLRFTIRVLDPNSRLSRQMSFVQDL